MLFQPRNPRRGVLLLVVMALLALMATVTMTFVLVSGVQMRSARGTALADLDTNSHEALLDGAMDQLLRGVEDPSSPIWTHSLLEDLYGQDTRLGSLTGSVSATPNAPSFQENGTVVDLSLDLDNKRKDMVDPSLHLNQTPGFYDGRLLTMLSGPTAFVTRRIVRSEPAGVGNVVNFQVMSFGGGLPKVGDKFIINDRPFDGTGFGLGLQAALMAGQEIADGSFDDTIDHALASGGITRPRALLPNHGRVANSDAELFDPQYPDPSGLGGADEDYDAPDYQNMHLAVMVADPTFGTKVIKPSFLDPALMNYFLGAGAANRPGGGTAAERDLARKLLFRPLASDHHPDFLQVNPAFDTDDWFKQGPWDVDNDGNGDPDSIWMDLGSPVQTDASGRQYKPLYAILCVDLDGRLNLNAHGSPMHLVRNRDSAGTWPLANFVGPFADRTGQDQLPLGQGYGPADILLNGIFKTTGTEYYGPDDLNYLLHGRVLASGSSIAGRYGEPSLIPGYNNLGKINIPMPGRTTLWNAAANAGNWGVNNEDDDLDGVAGNVTEKTIGQLTVPTEMADDNFPPSAVKQLDVLNPAMSTYDELAEFRGNVAARTPLDDLDGDGTIYSELRGAPVFASHGEDDDSIDDPYEIDLSRSNSDRRRVAVDDNSKLAEADAPFTPSDLEVLMRINDADVGTLSSRLLELAGDSFLNVGTPSEREYLRALVTTDSWDSPTSASMVGMPEETDSPFSLRGAELLVSRLADTTIGGSAHPAPHDTELRKGLFPRFFDGLKLNLNRPFGNSTDDDTVATDPGYGVIDEPGDGGATATTFEKLWEDPAMNGVLFDPDNNGTIDAMDQATAIKESNLARQAMARHLYILAMALRNRNAPDTSPAITARELAQWAINVVDFRDHDSIMTGFEYDPEPFDSNGWSVDGDLTTTGETSRAVVWGVERPELLITETVAGHDRGTDDDPANGGTALSGDISTNYDQVVRPDGWVAIELYNPQSITTPSPAELYDEYGLELSATAGTSPVWRMAFGKPGSGAGDHPRYHNPPTEAERRARHEPVLDDPVDESSLLGAGGSIERTVYFANTPPGLGDAGVEYYRTGGDVSIGPGRYAVIATQGVEANGTPVMTPNDLTVGRHHTGGGRPRINLEVASSVNGEPNWLDVELDGMTDPYPTYDGSTTNEVIRAPISVVIDQPYDAAAGDSRRMSISEPVAGYPGDPTTLAGMPDDNPWDETANEPWFGDVPLPEYGTHNFGCYNRVYLQRLANPTIPHNAETNPYLTVDSMPIDLWVYNSSAEQAATDATTTAEPENIRTRERRGEATLMAATDSSKNVWRQWAGDESGGLNAAPTASAKLEHTLGYLNSVWHEDTAANHRWWTPRRFQDDPNVLRRQPDDSMEPNNIYPGADATYYTGAPLTPSPWLVWNNRPFVSKYELMMVPKSNSAELLVEYSVRNVPMGFDVYENVTDEGEYHSDFDGNVVTHLLNFFHTSDKMGAGTAEANDLYRVFEFVDVPSRFSGLEEMLSPSAFTATAGTSTNPVFGWSDTSPYKRQFAPPFNFISKFREPGKVNINTVFDNGATWAAILGGFNNYSGAPTWQAIIDSRRGYSFGQPFIDAMTEGPELDLSTPTIMARPFRSFSGGHFAPTDALRHEGIESTLLRSGANVTPKKPLFALESTAANTNTDNNPMFRYQLMNRLSNMVTTRSNVYAVWITVGYFEVEPIDRSYYLSLPAPGNYTNEEIDRVFPDGYRLKGELGADTGEVERHRAFYMVDRLVPVAFERGKTHNTRKTIRLRTMIE